MTSKQWLIRFLQLKNDMIKQATGVDYIIQEDLNKVKEDVHDNECNCIKLKILYYIKEGNNIKECKHFKTCLYVKACLKEGKDPTKGLDCKYCNVKYPCVAGGPEWLTKHAKEYSNKNDLTDEQYRQILKQIEEENKNANN
jgi:hypothetical protein